MEREKPGGGTGSMNGQIQKHLEGPSGLWQNSNLPGAKPVSSSSLFGSFHRQLIWGQHSSQSHIYRMEPGLPNMGHKVLLSLPCRWITFVLKELFYMEAGYIVAWDAGALGFCLFFFWLETSHGWALVINYLQLIVENLPRWPLGSFQELWEMVLSTGTSSGLRTDDTAFLDCPAPVSMFALASFFCHCQYMQCFSWPFLPLGVSICYVCTFPSWCNSMLAKGKT